LPALISKTVSRVSRDEYVIGRQARWHVSATIRASVSAMRVCGIDRHPARQNIVASISSRINALAMGNLQLGEDRLGDVVAPRSPREECGELESQPENSQPGHAGGLLAGKK
jgi:hypothetical protein